MTITVQLSVDELKELLHVKGLKHVIEDYVAPVINTRLCVKCNAEFMPQDDSQHYCPSCRNRKGPG